MSDYVEIFCKRCGSTGHWTGECNDIRIAGRNGPMIPRFKPQGFGMRRVMKTYKTHADAMRAARFVYDPTRARKPFVQIRLGWDSGSQTVAHWYLVWYTLESKS